MCCNATPLYLLTFTISSPMHCYLHWFSSLGLEECRDARPPLAMEQIQTPSPCTYNYLTSFLCGNRRVPAGPLSSRSSCVPHCSSFASATSTGMVHLLARILLILFNAKESRKTLKLVRTNLWLHETASHGQVSAYIQ